jgi:hypothetical protein
MMRRAYAITVDLLADKRDRPRIELEASGFERSLRALAWLLVAACFAVVARYWPDLPAEVPQHFDARGRVDAWGPRAMVLGLPVLALVMVGGLSWLCRYPHLYNFPRPITEENARRQYALANRMLVSIQALTAGMLAALAWEVCRLAVGERALLGAWFLPVTMALLFGTLGVYCVRAHRQR